MLHKIKPVCEEEFSWIGIFQDSLLTLILTEEHNNTDITVDWIIEKLADLSIDEEWLRWFLQRKDRLNIQDWTYDVLGNLQALSCASDEEKQQLLEIYRANRAFEQLYEADNSCRVRKYTELQNQQLRNAYRAFLSLFYDPVFYPTQLKSGYPTNDEDDNFTREKFLRSFKNTNQLSVCVLCDFDLNEPEVDHFFPKKDFPELSCHHSNLVPICGSCNGRSQKGEQTPLDFDAEEQSHEWLHPYRRPINWDNVAINFASKVHVHLHSEQPEVAAQLSKLNTLISIDDRWNKRLPHIQRTTIKQLKALKRNIGSFNLRDKLEDWAESKECEIGELSTALLHTAYLDQSASGNALLLEELEAALEGDPA